MYEETCSHGYILTSCSVCRRLDSAEADVIGELFERFMAQHKDGQRSG